MIEYITHLLVLVMIYTLLSVSFSMTFNFTGLINLAHIGFFAIGAYSYALSVKHVSESLFLCLIIVIGVSALIGYLISLSTHRFKGDNFALVTLGFAVILDVLLKNLTWLTNGPLGISSISSPTFLGIDISTVPSAFINFAVVFTIIILGALKIIERKHGTSLLVALKEDEVLLNSLGKNTFRIKTYVIILSTIIASLAGALYASYIGFVDPYAFSITMLLSIIFISTLLGRSTSITRVVITVILVVSIPELIKMLDLPQHIIGPLQQIIYALALLVLILLYKNSLVTDTHA